MDRQQIIQSLKDIEDLVKSKSFKNKSGSDILKTSGKFNEQLIHLFIEHEYLKDTFLIDMLKAEDKDITVGQKRKIKNTIQKYIIPNIEALIEDTEDKAENTEDKVKNEEDTSDLGLPALDKIMEEIQREKLPVRIQSTHRSKFIDKKDSDCGTPQDTPIREETSKAVYDIQLKDTEDTNKKTEDVQPKTEVVQDVASYKGSCKKKSIINNVTSYVYNHFKNRTYTKDKIEVFVNQRMCDIIEDASTEDGDFEKISDILLDIVVCEKETLDIICVILITNNELNGMVIQALATAKIPMFRLRYSSGWAVLLNHYDLRLIEELLNNHMAPKCPACGLPMRQKENLKTRHRFYACMDNQVCRHTINID